MRVLYRDPSDETLAAAEVTGTTYYPEEEVLQFTGDNDFGVRVDQSTAEKLVRSLYLEGRVDVTAYESCNIEMEFDEDEEEDEEDFGDTIEDLLEEIVGDIRDEYDEDEEQLVTRLSDQEYIVAGAMNLDDLNDALDLEEKGLSLESEDYDSVGGIIIELLDRLPEVGDEVTTENGIRLVVDSVEKNRIKNVHIYLPDPPAAEDTKEE